MPSYGKAIRKHRIDKDMSAANLAKSMGVSREMVSAYERGRKKMTVKVLVGFCEAMSLTREEIQALLMLIYEEAIENHKVKS